MSAQGNETSWCTERARSILILPNPSLHRPCDRWSGASQSKAADVNAGPLEAHPFNFFLLYVHSWLKTPLVASLCSGCACPQPAVVTRGHSPRRVPLAGWCWELISDPVATGQAVAYQHEFSISPVVLVLLCRCGMVKANEKTSLWVLLFSC